MIRQNPPKTNAQKSVYYTHRFDVAPTSPKLALTGFESEINTITTPISESYIQNDLATLWVESTYIFALIKELHSLGYEILTEMSAIDKLEECNEFELFYLLLKLEDTSSKRLKIKTKIKKGQQISSLTPLFKSANWSERECYDMFGIIFNGHPYLQRLIMPKDWVGHPLLKSYPLQGDEYAAWYEVDKIFGKSYRDIIGAEQRDSARIDKDDDKNFSPINFESRYQEETAPILIKSFKTTKKLEKRR
ncbi:NADH-quinone oxidoreductase subunit C [Helicobacter hepaticus]|jgi:NADH-quinone oxidoreductase subunit C|uniref:Donor-ubiquinone reductase I n=1 Tax=Helicobacter hepaticus (strain ATCC 51449 / 3B1) TaxID=235279 RepID=Q7VFS4_HELHP|nr:NADH-quinone oxidoreductase subunit C [Helicobacter hepaticus]AAP78198.1 donor-ubiquinone reductase I [Helicobacter hepaticus ATCC 51449]